MTTFWVSLGMSGALTAALVPALRRWGLSDTPNERSSHTVPTPRGGGLAVLVALTLAVALAQADSSVWLALTPALALGAVGLADDVRSLSSLLRLAAQTATAVAAGVLIADRASDPPVALATLALVSTVGVVGFVNAFNFMDGVNAISALNAIVMGGWFTWVGHAYDLPSLTVLGAALAGAAAGFLPFNAASRVFLGDVGSYAIGALVASCAMLAWASGVPALQSFVPLAVYVADTGWVLLKRLRARAPLMQAHRDHVYQRLVRLGWPHLASAAWCAAISAACCVAAATLRDREPVLAVLAVALLVLLYLASPQVARRLETTFGLASWKELR